MTISFIKTKVLKAISSSPECCLSLDPHTSQGQIPKVVPSENKGDNGNNFDPEEKVYLGIILPPIVVANSCFQGQCLLVFSNRNNIIKM